MAIAEYYRDFGMQEFSYNMWHYDDKIGLSMTENLIIPTLDLEEEYDPHLVSCNDERWFNN